MSRTFPSSAEQRRDELNGARLEAHGVCFLPESPRVWGLEERVLVNHVGAFIWPTVCERVGGRRSERPASAWEDQRALPRAGRGRSSRAPPACRLPGKAARRERPGTWPDAGGGALTGQVLRGQRCGRPDWEHTSWGHVMLSCSWRPPSSPLDRGGETVEARVPCPESPPWFLCQRGHRCARPRLG